ncbi:RPS11 [Cordylochernes scorpioides]|uniref:RPS11 n=1 Tax=Cordylochernes scorpioides TaxID=51811 RepID=A0ABY6KBN1_9ARAC|nr:RPS11 [Cordylochernes scorpioides]
MASVEKMERLDEEELTNSESILKDFPYRKKAEKIDIGTNYERAYQKQPTIFINSKPGLAKSKSKSQRYTRNPGLGFKIPREAINGTYIDKKCPFTGNVSIRDVSYPARHSSEEQDAARHCDPQRLPSPIPIPWLFCRDVAVGDTVTVGECRALSKTIRFNVLKVVKSSSSAKSFNKF